MTSIDGRTVLVTGANRGIGREFVTQLLARGAATVLAGARDPQSVQVDDPRVVPVALDVTDPADIAAAAATYREVDIVVNNAGISTPTPIVPADTTALRRELEVNLFGPLAVTSAFADSLARHGDGAVVNVASAMAWLGFGGSYSVSKAALWIATDAQRLELAPRGVHVVGLFMGYVDTDMTAGVTEPKSTPAEIVGRALDGLEAGVAEVLADDVSRAVRGDLAQPAEQRYVPFVTAS